MPDQTSHEPTCAERLPAHLHGRLRDFRALQTLSELYDDDQVTPEVIAMADEQDIDTSAGTVRAVRADELAEAARERMYEMPLDVSKLTTFRVDLSTGGPGDWLEITCSGDTPCYEPTDAGEHYVPTRIVYHFHDWFDHAEQTLEGDDFAAAERFALQVVPELTF